MIKNHRMAFYYGQTKETGTSSTNDVNGVNGRIRVPFYS